MSNFESLKDAKIADMLEDYLELEKLIKNLPLLTENKLLEFKNDILSLEDALKVAPAAYDQAFRTKLNTLIDVAIELESFAKVQQAQLKSDFRDEIKTQTKLLSHTIAKEVTEQVTTEVTKHIKDSFIVSPLAAGGYVIFVSILGGLIAGGLMFLTMTH